MEGRIEFALPQAAYKPSAVFYPDSDSLEYVRFDCPNVYRRVDELLSLILDMDSRLPIGFRLKGFENYFLKLTDAQEHNFPLLVSIIEKAVAELGEQIRSKNDVRCAYEQVIEIARADHVRTPDRRAA